MPDDTIWDAKKGPKPREEEVELPALVTASSLLPPEPEIPQDFDEETPPGPPFIVVRNAYGPGAHSVKLGDGTPVGVYIHDHDMTPDEVSLFLGDLGLDADLIEFFVRNRGKAMTADVALTEMPEVQAFAQEEERTKQSKEAMSKAFIEAYRKKKGEKA